jgi:hypothetical protein
MKNFPRAPPFAENGMAGERRLLEPKRRSPRELGSHDVNVCGDELHNLTIKHHFFNLANMSGGWNTIESDAVSVILGHSCFCAY